MVRLCRVLGLIFLGLSLLLIGAFLALRATRPVVADVPALNIPTDPERIEHGRYLANHVTMCMECHSQRDWTRYAAPIVQESFGQGGEHFPGDFGLLFSSNLTPWALEDWSDEDLYRAVANGVSRDGRPLFPLMPYPQFGRLPLEDIEDIIAYLRTLEPAQSVVPSRQLKIPFTALVYFMPEIPSHQPRPDRTEGLAYGKYLTEAAVCTECHTPKKQGQPISGMEMAGGFEFEIPGGWVRSANLTPDPKTGLGGWTREQFVARFKAPNQKHNRVTLVKEGKMNTIMPWASYAGMDEEDLGAIFDYLMSLPAVENEVEIFRPKSVES